VAVKGSKFKPMRVIPHSPARRVLRYGLLILVLLVGFPASYFLGAYQAQLGQKETEEKLNRQSQQLAGELNQELTLLRTNAEVDRQTMEELRQLVMTQRAQISASERDLRVYKDLLAPGGKTNPQGISFGVFTLIPQKEKGHFNYSLVVQKLSTKEGDFAGTLDFNIIGQQSGKTQTLALNQISAQTGPNIPLDFKYFQTVEGELILPADFVPQNVGLSVKGGDKKNIVETQLEWPDSSIVKLK